jgi:plasmid maintenance system antidote protein VapI
MNDEVWQSEKAFGVKMDTLMRMQSSYDIAQTRKRAKPHPRPADSPTSQHFSSMMK